MINEQIKAKEVRLISSEGEQLGIVSINEARDKAEEAGLDLVLIAPTAKPPVCKIIDYGKFRYEIYRRILILMILIQKSVLPENSWRKETKLKLL